MMKTLGKLGIREFPGGPVVKNLPSNAGYVGLIPCWGTKIPHATASILQLKKAHMLQRTASSAKIKRTNKVRNKWNFLNLIEHLQNTYN